MNSPKNSREADMDISKVRELVKMVEESGIEELEVIHKDTTIRIQKSPTYAAGATVAPAPMVIPAAVPQAAPAAAPAAAEAVPDAARAKFKDVRSPIVGTLYRAPSPESDNFVTVGDHVVVGQTLCIIEAMKVMNEIDAEFAGTIREILVENGAPVEAEGVLFLVEPD
jgi:acetyl-CoA carboxylase biotin carboxyl carrier protein